MKRLILSYLFLFPAIGSFAWNVKTKDRYDVVKTVKLAETRYITKWDIATIDFTLNPGEYVYVTGVDAKYLYCQTGVLSENTWDKERKLPLRLPGGEGYDQSSHPYKDLIAERLENGEYFEKPW